MTSNQNDRKLKVADETKSKISEYAARRAEFKKTPTQEVVRVVQAVNTPEHKNVNTPKQDDKAPIGKPTLKQPGVTYARLSPRIPVSVKKQLDIALIHGGYNDENGQPIRYIDEFVAEAVRRMLANRPDSL